MTTSDTTPSHLWEPWYNPTDGCPLNTIDPCGICGRPKADHPSTICPSCDGEPHPYKGCWNPDCVDGYVGAADQEPTP